MMVQTHTPVYLAWIKKISYVAYGYSGLVKNEFEGLHIHTTQVHITSPHQILSDQMIELTGWEWKHRQLAFT